MSLNKEKERMQLIFRALDEMKSNKESISAQKLAAYVKMGKQTVLPFYRKWLQEEQLTEAEKFDLSDNLQRAIKKELAKAKFELGEQFRDIEEKLNDSEVMNNTLNQKNTELTIKVQQAHSNLQLEKEHALKERTLHQKTIEEQNITLNSHQNKIELLTSQIDSMHQQLKDKDTQHKTLFIEHEQRLEQAHQKMLDHWINIVDTERTENERIRKHLKAEKKIVSEQETVNSKLNQQLIHLKNDIQVLEKELQNQSVQNDSLQKKIKIIDELKKLTGHPTCLIEQIKKLIFCTDKYRVLKNDTEMVKQELKEAQKKLERTKEIYENQADLERENLRLNGYIEGLKHK